MSETPPAGWYPDPQDASSQRYWDGTTWTEHTAPGAQQTSPTAGGGQPAYAQSAGLGASAPDPWLWQSIVATVLCCLPAGIPGIVYAAKSQKLAGAGDLAGATQAARTARTWTLVSVGIGVLSALLVVGMMATGVMMEGFTTY